MAHDERERRDAAGIGPYARERENLVALSSLGSWNVSDGEPDIRGWEVRTVSGRQLGQVSELLVDPKAGEVVMLDVDLPGTDRHSFVPIRVVEIDRERRLILMDSADLPAEDLQRTTPVVEAASGTTAAGALRYPRAEREVVVEPVAPAGRVVPADRLVATDPVIDADRLEPEVIEDRRRAERRRIERMSTDL